jgi:type I restriction enzyme S subunit
MAAPKLRFKEFDNQWDKTTINDQAQTVTSGSRDWAQYYSESGDKFIRMTNLVRDGIYLDLSDLKFVQLPKDSNEGKRTSLKFGDILISITAELGKLGWIPEGLGTAYINQHTALVRMKDSVDSKFVAYSLSTEKYNNKLNSLNDSGAKAGLNLGTIRNFELIVPAKAEQTKIASFLSVVDEKISQLTQKHALLSQYKQGMMQKLFSQQIRFKADDGSEFGEWEEKTLGSLGVFKSGQGFPEKYQGGKTGVPFFKVSDMNTYGNEKRMVVANNYVDADSILEMKVKVILDESIIFAKVGAAVFLERKRLATNFLIDNNMMAFTPDPKLNINFIKQFLDTIKFSNFVQVGALPSYNAGDLAIIPIHIPCVVEQTKIANFLSAIDQKIDVVAQQIEQTKQWKKGLLQQMFV